MSRLSVTCDDELHPVEFRDVAGRLYDGFREDPSPRGETGGVLEFSDLPPGFYDARVLTLDIPSPVTPLHLRRPRGRDRGRHETAADRPTRRGPDAGRRRGAAGRRREGWLGAASAILASSALGIGGRPADAMLGAIGLPGDPTGVRRSDRGSSGCSWRPSSPTAMRPAIPCRGSGSATGPSVGRPPTACRRRPRRPWRASPRYPGGPTRARTGS